VSTLAAAVSRFGRAATEKLSNPAVTGSPEDQLRAPLEELVQSISRVLGVPTGEIVMVGETAMADISSRPDYSVTRLGTLIGFVEVKSPGKGADPRRFRGHDKEQWQRLKLLPNLLYTDGNSFSLWHNGDAKGALVKLIGNIESDGDRLAAPPVLQELFADFLQWKPVPPRSLRQLAETSARLCRLLRDEVVEQIGAGAKSLTSLADDWRKLLFPKASDQEFADGYAQAVTFGLLMAKAQGISLADGLDRVASKLQRNNSLIGNALKLLIDRPEGDAILHTSLSAMTRVLDAVNWKRLNDEGQDSWLYFYEEFLASYDSKLRQRTGSYYTPPQVVTAMVRLVDDALRDPDRFNLTGGLASREVKIVDPALGTGTFLLGVLRKIAATVEEDQGAGAVPARIRDSLRRLIGFEIQFGPFAVAQLRILAEVAALAKDEKGVPSSPRVYIADTLANPDEENEQILSAFEPLAQSRRDANAVKRSEKITVVIGNPPYKEHSMGLGGWIENGVPGSKVPSVLKDWVPPAAWGTATHAGVLRNLYVYFWRWATWKVFGDGSTIADLADRNGIISFITVNGFLNGPGFEKMRADLRRDACEIWVIDCSPEKHQPPVNTRVFQDVQQPVCIVIAARKAGKAADSPAAVRFRSLGSGTRQQKFAELATLTLGGDGWQECPSAERMPFLPAATGSWATYPDLDSLFTYDGLGMLAARSWVAAPDAESLRMRWNRLTNEKDAKKKAELFYPHLRKGKPADRHVAKVLTTGLHGQVHRPIAVADDNGPVMGPVRYAFRSFDRQWLIPDNRLLHLPNPTLWDAHSDKQVYITVLKRTAPRHGPAFTISGLIPDYDHYRGSFGGRVMPLWADRAATQPNIRADVLAALSSAYAGAVTAEEVMAYLAAVAAHPAYVARFSAALAQPGLRIPITADEHMFKEAVGIGRKVIWLHAFGERFADRSAGRPPGAPRLPKGSEPRIPGGGSIPGDAERMPDTITYDTLLNRIVIGTGYIENVPKAVWDYEVSGLHVIPQWFSYRRKSRVRPMIGQRRAQSELSDIQQGIWLSEYTDDLIDIIHVLGLLVAMEPQQADLLTRISLAPTLDASELGPQRSKPKTRRGARPKAKVEGQLTILPV
jgi:Type ISP C-terminal specificity domain/N-6 DNA Methylase